MPNYSFTEFQIILPQRSAEYKTIVEAPSTGPGVQFVCQVFFPALKNNPLLPFYFLKESMKNKNTTSGVSLILTEFGSAIKVLANCTFQKCSAIY